MTVSATADDCYRVEDHWNLRNRHEPTCPGDGCEGCVTCHRHCGCRKACKEHVDPSNPLTAPACIGRVRGHLRSILKMLPDLLPEAINDGLDSEATMLAGRALDTAARIEAHGHRQFAIATGSIPGDVEEHDRHPLIVLGWWEVELRRHYNQELPDHLPGCVPDRTHCEGCRPVTEQTAASYLEQVLDRVAQDPDQDFSELATELAECVGHLEVQLHNSRRPETGAPCPTCAASIPEAGTGSDKAAPRLRKHYAAHADQTMRHANRSCPLGATFDPVTGRSRCPTCRGDEDTWHCPDVPAHWWTDHDYRNRVDDDYLANASALTATQMRDTHGLNPATLRTWVHRGLVAKRGRNSAGQQLYDVAQALDQKTRNRAHQETA